MYENNLIRHKHVYYHKEKKRFALLAYN